MTTARNHPTLNVVLGGLAVLAVLAGLAVVTPAGASTRSYSSDAEALVADLVNEARAELDDSDVAPLEATSDLVELARTWSTGMADAQEVRHDPRAGDGVCCWDSLGEVVIAGDAPSDPSAYGPAIRAMIEQALDTPGNRTNLLRPRTDHVGVGVVHETAGTLWVTIYVREWDGTALDLDQTPPTVNIDAPADGEQVYGTVTVSGTATDDRVLEVTTLAIGDGEPIALVLTDGQFSATVDTAELSEGPLTLTAYARDTAQHETTHAVTVQVTHSPQPAETATPDDEAGTEPEPEASTQPGIDAVAGATAPQDDDRPAVLRLDGATREVTAATISASTFVTADVVVIARADGFADALAGAPLAVAHGAPLLLNPSDVGAAGDGRGLHGHVAAELDRLTPSTVILLGGTSALGPDVAREIADRFGAHVVRFSGRSRFETAVHIAEALVDASPSRHAYLVEGRGAWADAVSSAAIAGWRGSPIVLTDRDALNPHTAAFLDGSTIDHVTIVGGPAVVSESVADQLRAFGMAVDRLHGADRYGTSAAVAAHAHAMGLSTDEVWLSTGRNYPDALAAGAAAVARRATVLLVDGLNAEGGSATRSWLRARGGELRFLTVTGGTAAVTEAVLDALAQDAKLG